jgi:hypothetical protein
MPTSHELNLEEEFSSHGLNLEEELNPHGYWPNIFEFYSPYTSRCVKSLSITYYISILLIFV